MVRRKELSRLGCKELMSEQTVPSVWKSSEQRRGLGDYHACMSFTKTVLTSGWAEFT